MKIIKTGLNLVIKTKDNCVSTYAAACICRKFIKDKYILEEDKKHYIRLESSKVSDTFYVEFIHSKFNYRLCTEKQYAIYFKEYYSKAIIKLLIS